jgi:hypothetical protein
MARRIFDVVDIIEILVYWHAGRNNSEIAQSLGVDRKTARKCISAAQAAGMSPGRRLRRNGGLSWRGSGSRSWPVPGCGR